MQGDKKFTNKIWQRFCVQQGMRILSGTILGFSLVYGLGISGSLLDRIKRAASDDRVTFWYLVLHAVQMIRMLL
jgi:hypothetical protein